MEISYSEVSVGEIMDFFIHGNNLSGSRIVKYEYYLDPGKHAVVFKLYTEENKN